MPFSSVRQGSSGVTRREGRPRSTTSGATRAMALKVGVVDGICLPAHRIHIIFVWLSWKHGKASSSLMMVLASNALEPHKFESNLAKPGFLMVLQCFTFIYISCSLTAHICFSIKQKFPRALTCSILEIPRVHPWETENVFLGLGFSAGSGWWWFILDSCGSW